MSQENESNVPISEEKETFLDKEQIDNAVEVLQSAMKKLGKQEKDEGLLMPYFRAFIKKMLENFSSAKMLMFFLPLWTSCFFLWILFGMSDEFTKLIIDHPDAAPQVNKFFEIAMNGFISWCTFTVSLGGTIIVVRETFKVQKLKALKEDYDPHKEFSEISV